MARVAQYTENVSFLASLDMKAAIEEIADTYQVSAGAVWRRAVEVGIERTRQEYAGITLARSEPEVVAEMLATPTGTVSFSG
jgi:hypothetical protein